MKSIIVYIWQLLVTATIIFLLWSQTPKSYHCAITSPVGAVINLWSEKPFRITDIEQRGEQTVLAMETISHIEFIKSQGEE